MLISDLAVHVQALAYKAPDINAEAPGWANGFNTILNWASWFAFGVCILGVIISGGAMAIASRRGEGGDHATRLGWVLMGCVLIGGASGVVTALTGGAGS